MVMERDLIFGAGHTVQYTDDGLQNCTHETYIILLTNVTPIHSINFLKKKKYKPSKQTRAHKFETIT